MTGAGIQNKRKMRDLARLGDFLRIFGKGRKIGVFGDSVIRGVLYEKKTGKFRTYHGRFAEAKEKYGIEISNNAKIGYTTSNGLTQIKDIIDESNCPEFVILEYGGNDCNFDWKAISDDPTGNHEPTVPPDKFRSNYEDMIIYVRTCGGTPVMMIPPPVDAPKFLSHVCKKGGLDRKNIIRWLGDVAMIYRWQEYYSDLCADIAQKTDCPVIDIRRAFLSRRDFKRLIGHDGIHPTSYGHKLIDAEVMKFLKSAEEK